MRSAIPEPAPELSGCSTSATHPSTGAPNTTPSAPIPAMPKTTRRPMGLPFSVRPSGSGTEPMFAPPRSYGAAPSTTEPAAALVDAQLVAEDPCPTELHDLAGDRLERLGSFGSRLSYNDRAARVPALTYCRDQRYLPKKRYTELLRELGPPAVAE